MAEPPIGHPKEWRVTRLGDITRKIGSGATPTGGEASYLPQRSTFALVRSQNVYDRRFESAGLAFISDKQAELLKGVALQEDDLLLNITGDGITFARSCLVPSEILPACVNQHVAIVRVDQTVADPGFVLSFLTHPTVKSYIESFNAGGSRRAITKGHIESFLLALPSRDEQRAIACILDTLDDKMELSRTMGETLEAIASALFKSWFVDFDPVRAKAEGRDPGLPSILADLFPDSLENSDLGEIPKGWRPTLLRDLIQTIRGRSYTSEELTDSRTALVTLKSFARGGGYRPDGLKAFTGRFTPEQIVRPGEIVIASTDVTQAAEVIGRPAIVRASAAFDTLVASLDTMIVRPVAGRMSLPFLYYLAKTHAFTTHTYAHTTGTTVLHLAKEAVPSFLFAKPPQQLLHHFGAVVQPALDRIAAAAAESDLLGVLRDTLLPKLISGELRVRSDLSLRTLA